ncbi:MAG: hypothetical protein D3906_00870 [Candidatus Electrothrix sp. AUS1_2]|nr:hypothetical protein [Candidatus Electrothrix sp. AUS1_2]
MGDVKIESKNQSGGITAQNVNVGESNNISVKESKSSDSIVKRVFWWVFGLVGAAAAIVTVISYIN